jgi:phosphate-selective porin OprO/OprP
MWVVAILGFGLVFLPGAARAADSEALLDLLREEKVITVDQAEKMKKKVAKIEKKKKLDWQVYWSNGLNIQSKDGKHKIKIGGRIQVDFASISSPKSDFVDALEQEQGANLVGFGAEFRRARLFVSGTVYRIIQFKAQYDFAGGDADFKDVWLGLTKVPYVGHIRVGHMKEPFSLEDLTSSKYITFMERALPNIFAPGRNTGIRLHNTAFKSKRLWWGVGVFQDVNDFGDSFNNYQDWNFTGRIAGTPFYRDKGRKLLHLGFGYSHQFRNNRRFALRYRARPEAHITDVRPLTTTAGGTPRLNTSGIDLINPEMAFVWGPFSVQGEYFWSFVNAKRQTFTQVIPLFPGNPTSPLIRNVTVLNPQLKGSNPYFQGGYLFASFFLTGENRKYSLKSATFGRIKPKRNFDLRGGPGAWEVAFRWSYLNLNSRVSSDPIPIAGTPFFNTGPQRGVRGGIENNFTVALNWYLTPNTRWMLNYIYCDISNRRITRGLVNNVGLNVFNNNRTVINGPLHIVQTRFQIDF